MTYTLATVVLAQILTLNPSYIVALSGRDNGTGHGCPVSRHLMLTAAHMTEEPTPFGANYLPLRWSDGDGKHGVVQHVVSDPAADVSLMESVRPFGRWFPVAAVGPTVGEVVYIVGYDFDRNSYKQPRVVRTKVVSESAGRIYTKDDADFGSSGSCTLNERLEVVGINNTKEGRDSFTVVGGTVAVYGDWLLAAMRARVDDDTKD